MSLQRNVQQQNELTFDDMLARAQLFRAHGIPIGVRNFLAMQGIDVDTSVIVQASEGYVLGFPFGLGGMLLTAAGGRCRRSINRLAGATAYSLLS